MKFIEVIKWLPGTDGCRVLVEETQKKENEEADRADLGFRDSQDGGLKFVFEFFGKSGAAYYTSEIYYKPDGVSLTEFSLKTLDKTFPEGAWPRKQSAKPFNN